MREYFPASRPSSESVTECQRPRAEVPQQYKPECPGDGKMTEDQTEREQQNVLMWGIPPYLSACSERVPLSTGGCDIHREPESPGFLRF